MNCQDCGTVFNGGGRGRPRIRCFGCSPEQKRPAGTYATSATREILCPHCQQSFVSTFDLQVYCSHKCRNDFRNKAVQIAARDRSARACGHCGEAFAPAYGDWRRVYCSEKCADRRHWKLRSGNHIQRARRFGCRIVTFDRIAVFERDGWRCRFCGIDTPRTLLGSVDGRAPELDHVIPLSRKGDHSFENSQLLCRDCNLTKGNRTTAELVLLLGA